MGPDLKRTYGVATSVMRKAKITNAAFVGVIVLNLWTDLIKMECLYSFIDMYLYRRHSRTISTLNILQMKLHLARSIIKRRSYDLI